MFKCFFAVLYFVYYYYCSKDSSYADVYHFVCGNLLTLKNILNDAHTKSIENYRYVYYYVLWYFRCMYYMYYVLWDLFCVCQCWLKLIIYHMFYVI